MASKRYSVEQIVAKLREMERLQGQGMTIPQACKRLGISDRLSTAGVFATGHLRSPPENSYLVV